ncbi:MAG: GNAT family N-acetyltransferase [Pyrinomonadaceae bacterium]|nr:GNAT family N-acetyltransferase [Pyrinomonadaceae bacterium]
MPEPFDPGQAEILVTGYMHPGYAEALAEFGTPRLLPRSGGWILERPIRGSAERDAMGCYPLFACQDWTGLEDDLSEVCERLVSLVLVSDPFGNYSAESLRSAFGDLVIPFKEHFIVDLSLGPEACVHAHHRRNARKALEEVEVEACEDAAQVLDEWQELYSHLIERHAIKGISAFSKESFACQLKVPGAHLFRAVHAGSTVGMLWWYRQGEVAYYHLGAYNEAGYRLRASFALFWRAIEYFAASGLRWLNLGAGAGLSAEGSDGLTRFKRGWATGTRTAYLCGRIFQPDKYRELAGDAGGSNYFPAYRRGEFA